MPAPSLAEVHYLESLGVDFLAWSHLKTSISGH